MHTDDVRKTRILRGISQKAHRSDLPGLRLSEGGHTIDARGLPIIGVVEIELRDQNEVRDFERQVRHAQKTLKNIPRDVFKNAR